MTTPTDPAVKAAESYLGERAPHPIVLELAAEIRVAYAERDAVAQELAEIVSVAERLITANTYHVPEQYSARAVIIDQTKRIRATLARFRALYGASEPVADVTPENTVAD